MTEKTSSADSSRPRTRWQGHITDDLHATAFALEAALKRAHPRPAFAAALEAHLVREERLLEGQPTGLRARWWRRRTRRLFLFAVALSLTVLSGAAYAVFVSPGDQVLLHIAGEDVVVTDNLGAPVSLTRRACGFAVTVNRVYVDQQQAIVAYTASAPHGYTVVPQHFSPSRTRTDTLPSLTVGSGHSFSFSGGAWGREASFFGQNAAGHVLFFKPFPGFDPAAALRVHLIIPYIELAEVQKDGLSRVAACATREGSKPAVVTVKGPFTYDLTVPVPAAHVATVQRSVRVGDLTVRVTLMEITPLNTRVYFTVSGGDQAHISWYTLLQRTHLAVPSHLGSIQSDRRPVLLHAYDTGAGTPYGALPDCSFPAADLTAQQLWLCRSLHNHPWWAALPPQYRPTYSQGFQDPAPRSLCVADFFAAPLYTYRGDVTFIFGPIEGHRATAHHRFTLRIHINPTTARAPNLVQD